MPILDINDGMIPGVASAEIGGCVVAQDPSCVGFLGLSLPKIKRELEQINVTPQASKQSQDLFSTAKKLFLYGYFEYQFFTASQFYALIALEAAIINRWEDTLAKASYRLLRSQWMKTGMKVDGEAFPNSVRKVLDRLVKKKIIDRNVKDRCDVLIKLRNEHAHQTLVALRSWPGYGTLREVANLINELYA